MSTRGFSPSAAQRAVVANARRPTAAPRASPAARARLHARSAPRPASVSAGAARGRAPSTAPSASRQRSVSPDRISSGGASERAPQLSRGGRRRGGARRAAVAVDFGPHLTPLLEADAALAASGIALPDRARRAAQRTGGAVPTEVVSGLLRLSAEGGSLERVVASLGVPVLTERLLKDPRILFKVTADVVIDGVCCIIAELDKRGVSRALSTEAHLVLGDLIVGLVLDAALVLMMAPAQGLGARRRGADGGAGASLVERVRISVDALPATAFERGAYTTAQRVQSVAFKGAQYLVVGTACGVAGLSLANGLVAASGGDASLQVDVWHTAMVWGVFMGVSSNVRLQTVVGLERLLEDTPWAAKRAWVLAGGTLALRLANNVIGGENYIDMARFFGVQ
ncbi:unnamed protein product [Pedinophyceae sp. YPF-701]|nr:unnamed protein product [Pedinophyceae sp. YPF-701]